MLIVQASETPEFVFGTGIQGSRASVETQMPIVTQKAERKRAQLEHPFKQLIDAYIDRRIRLSDPDFLKLKNADYEINIEFPDLQMEGTHHEKTCSDCLSVYCRHALLLPLLFCLRNFGTLYGLLIAYQWIVLHLL